MRLPWDDPRRQVRPIRYHPHPQARPVQPRDWDKAQTAIASRHSRRRHAKAHDRIYPLTGLLVCADCHSPCRGQSARGFTYYRDAARDYGRNCKNGMVRSRVLEDELVTFFSRLKITENVKQKVLRRLGSGVNMKRAEKDRLSLEGQLERIKQLFVLGDLSETKYLQEKAKLELALTKLQPAAQPVLDLQETVRLLQTYGGVLNRANDTEKKAFFAAVLSEVFVKNKKIVALRPKPNYYDLLVCVSSAPEWI